MESILTSIKKLLHVSAEDTHFDTDIIFHINTVFSQLHMLGVGPDDCFFIRDDMPIWTDFTKDEARINNVKSYVYLKVKLMFDPPLSSSVLEAMERQITELEWRLTVTADLIKY